MIDGINQLPAPLSLPKGHLLARWPVWVSFCDHWGIDVLGEMGQAVEVLTTDGLVYF